MAKRIILLGSTGSIGSSTLDVVRDFPDRFQVVGLSARSRIDLLSEQVREFQPECVCISDSAVVSGNGFSGSFSGVSLLHGPDGVTELVRRCEADLLVVATVGFAGLLPTLAGIEKGMAIALANKEVLVVGGDIVMAAARRAGTPILPIDSEHNAIAQCLAGNSPESIRRLILTASGGPFRSCSREELESVTAEQALRHPTWSMGPKITIDCATMMNKGFEVIEACHLFGISPDRVEVVIHPQSTIHSMVEYVDGSILAQMGPTNMYLPILNILSYPERLRNKFQPLDLTLLGQLDFEAPRRDLFPCLDYAYEAIGVGGTMPVVLNAANEVAVQAFLDGRIRFTDICGTVRGAMDRHELVLDPNLNALCDADRWARETAEEYARNLV